MPDREKVIKGLETIKQFFGYGLPSTAEMFDSYYGTLNDAIALLQEQEAVEPYQRDAVWLCGYCTKEVVGWTDDITGEDIRYPFCRQCGRSVKWE